MSLWEFENVTRGFTYAPSIQSLGINNQQPCQLATLAARLQDVDESYIFANHDKLKSRFAGTVIHAGNVSRFTREGTGQEPRVYILTAQDFTARLKRDVIDAKRDVAETVKQRVLWILSHSTQGFTTTGVANITDEVDPLDTRDMDVLEALQQTAGEVGASFFVNFDEDVQFFVDPPGGAAPFAIRSSSSPAWTTADPPIRDLSIPSDSEGQVNAWRVRGDGIAVWRIDQDSIDTYGRIEDVIVDTAIKTVRRAQRVGDTALLFSKDPTVSGSVILGQPGLLPMQSVRVDARTRWSVDADFIVESTQISYMSLTKMSMAVNFADRFRPCSVRPPSLGDLPNANDDGNDGDPTDGGGCTECQKTVVFLPAGMDENLSIQTGRTGNVHVYDGTTLRKYDCGLAYITENTSAPSALGVIYHEPGTHTALTAGDRTLKVDSDDNYGGVRDQWDDEIDVVSADVTDRKVNWVAGTEL
jgi:hypothetical protein